MKLFLLSILTLLLFASCKTTSYYVYAPTYPAYVYEGTDQQHWQAIGKISPGERLIVKKVGAAYGRIKLDAGERWVRYDSMMYIAKATQKQYKNSFLSYNKETASYSTRSASSSYSTGRTKSSGASSSSGGGSVQVKGYTRKDGTYVRPHTRSAPKKH